MAGVQTVVRKRKYDGSVKSRWEGTWLDSPHADWIVVLHDPRIHSKYTGNRALRDAAADDPCFLHCLCIAAPLTVLIEYDYAGHFAGAKCDAALPAMLGNRFVEYVDLDLDLIVEWDFSTYVRDEDTFHINREGMGYPEQVIAQAWAGLKLAQRIVAARAFPFDAERLSLQQG